MPESAPFRPRARIVGTLGADLISSERVALVELVKNAYDADATTCLIAYGPAESGTGRELVVLDDGHGMTLDELTSGWLDLAGTAKVKTRLSESKGRPLLGEKGVGRLAASRLGSELMVTTRRRGHEECQLMIDWAQFRNPDLYLDQIEVAVTTGESDDLGPYGRASRLRDEAGVEHEGSYGTMLTITGETQAWTHDDVAEIQRALQRLVAPATVGTRSDFRIVLSLPSEFEDLAGEVGPPQFTTAPLYRLRATVDESGDAVIEFDGQHPDLVPRSKTRHLWTADRKPVCGPFTVEIRAWDLDREGIDLAAPTMGVRDFRRQLAMMAGVSMYRDGFRLFPYGERGDDWLGLDLRRVNQPTMRVSNNQIIGFVFLSHSRNPLLQDQSNREGLIDNVAYDDLRTMVTTLTAELEALRVSLRRREKPAEPTGGLFDNLTIDDLPDVLRSHGAKAEVIAEVERRAELISGAVQVVKDTLTRFQMHATLGQLVDRVVHEGRNAIAPLRNKANLLSRAVERSDDNAITKRRDELLSTVESQASLLGALFDGLDPLSGRKRGRPANVNAMRAINEAVRASDTTLCPTATITVEGNDTRVRWAESDIILAVVNLINNALYWLSGSGNRDKAVRVTFTRVADDQVLIRVSDNGPGVDPQYEGHIFDPYFSLKSNGVGLGLSIVGSIADNYGGALTLSEHPELGGASFELTLGRHV
ncbi:histidine kinase/DNA gyrase B/HSP90-like ATPase [Yimella lutea]|uniref:histidine kinase n=1 Tax=Yimella lutea TaxID=587872 RepID=A0A542EGL4_9MICO|nr:ATP-binding protein [Yimella lutea]TQJ14481.1 histidine kinase/DNA gyrase B/HSP90-like ATPase [Yimella lutea]